MEKQSTERDREIEGEGKKKCTEKMVGAPIQRKRIKLLLTNFSEY